MSEHLPLESTDSQALNNNMQDRTSSTNMLQGDAASVLHTIVVVIASVQTTAIGRRLEHDSERPVVCEHD